MASSARSKRSPVGDSATPGTPDIVADVVAAMQAYISSPSLDPHQLLALHHLLGCALLTAEPDANAIATHARSYSSQASDSFASSDRELGASSASSRERHPLNEEQLDEVVVHFRRITGRSRVSKPLRGLLAARARDIGYKKLIRRVELRFAASQGSENLLAGIERDDWDADLPTPPAHQQRDAPAFEGDLPDGPAPAPIDDRPFDEQMAAHGCRREDL